MKIFLFFIIWSIWISSEFLLGPFSHVRIHDNGDSLLPQLIAEKINFKEYGVPYFFPNAASGVDAASQTLIPLSNLNSTLFILIPPYIAYGLIMLIQRFLASYFSYKLARDSLNLNYFPSIIAGLLFSLFNFSMFSFTLYHQLGTPALPFTIYVLEKIFQLKNLKKYIYLIPFALFIGWSNDFVYFTPYIIPIIFIWFIFIKKNLNIKLLLNLTIFSTFCLIPQLQNLAAILTNAPLSHRAQWDLENLYPVTDISQTFGQMAHFFWANIISISIIILSFKFLDVKKGHFDRLLIVSVLIILFTFFAKNLQRLIPMSLGFIRTFTFDRFEMTAYFFLSFTAAYALNLSYRRIKRYQALIVAILIIILIGASVKIKIETLKNYAPFQSLYMQPDLQELTKITGDKNRVVTIAGGGIRPQYMIAYGLSTVDGYLTLYPKDYHNFWAKIIKNSNETKYLDFTSSGNKIYLYGPEDFNNLSEINLDSYYNLNLLSISNVKYFISTKPLSDKNLILLKSPYREKFTNWQNYSRWEKLKTFFQREYFGPPLYIYENQEVYPRYFTIENGKIETSKVEIIKYAPDKIELDVKSESPSELIVSVNYYPFWKAIVNGKDAKIEKFEDTFIKINLPKDHNIVIIEYDPPYKISFN